VVEYSRLNFYESALKDGFYWSALVSDAFEEFGMGEFD
jgi:hypothetical protein